MADRIKEGDKRRVRAHPEIPVEGHGRIVTYVGRFNTGKGKMLFFTVDGALTIGGRPHIVFTADPDRADEFLEVIDG